MARKGRKSKQKQERFTQFDIDGVKELYDMREVVSNDNGKEWRNQKNWLTNSPLREDRSPSFEVSKEFAYDHALREHFDIFKYMEMQHGLGFVELMKKHSQQEIKQAIKKVKRRQEKPEEDFESPFTVDYYNRIFRENRSKGYAFMETRGFTEAQCIAFSIGYAFSKNAYHMKDGSVIRSAVGRTSIPYGIGSDVHSVAMRVDPEDLARRIKKHGKRMLRVQKDMIARSKGKLTSENIRQSDIVDAIWGAKYKYLYGGKVTLFNGGVLLKQIEPNDYEFKRRTWLPELCIDEGAINAMTLDIHGIVAVSNRDYKHAHMDRITERTGRINIPIHNDEDKLMHNGDTFNPGMRYYEKHKAGLSHGDNNRVRGLKIPTKYGDVNDFWVQDPTGFKKWIEKQGLQRMPHYCTSYTASAS